MNIQIFVRMVILWLSIILLPLFVYLWSIPQVMEHRERQERQRIPTVQEYIDQGYDTYEYEGDWGDHPGDHDDTTMPGPMLECDAGDHTCID